MEIKTKYSIGDILFYLDNNQITVGKVVQIEVTVYDNQRYSIWYDMKPEGFRASRYSEKALFKTKSNLIKHLSK